MSGRCGGRLGALVTPSLLVYGTGGLAYGGIHGENRYIAASREIQWRQDRTHLLVQWLALTLSIISLSVAVLVAVFK